jgi:hypothetical protein
MMGCLRLLYNVMKEAFYSLPSFFKNLFVR